MVKVHISHNGLSCTFWMGTKKQPAGGRAEDWGELAMADSWYFVSVRGNIRKNRQGRLRGRALG